MDVEWAKDADDGRLYILQARPETVHRAERRAVIEIFSLTPGDTRERLASGAAIGQRIGVGPTRVLRGGTISQHSRPAKCSWPP